MLYVKTHEEKAKSAFPKNATVSTLFKPACSKLDRTKTNPVSVLCKGFKLVPFEYKSVKERHSRAGLGRAAGRMRLKSAPNF